jgi:hypothetical protein
VYGNNILSMTSSDQLKPREEKRTNRSRAHSGQVTHIADTDRRGISSSVKNVVDIRPRSPRPPDSDIRDMDDVELSLLGDEEHFRTDAGLPVRFSHSRGGKRPFPADDRKAMMLLVTLCSYFTFRELNFAYFHEDLIQGVPVSCFFSMS